MRGGLLAIPYLSLDLFDALEYDPDNHDHAEDDRALMRTMCCCLSASRTVIGFKLLHAAKA